MRFLRHALALIAAAILIVPIAAQSVEADLQRAIQKETTTGDLTAAIADYQAIARRAVSTPAVAAKALLRLAETYQKRGDAEARKVYEQILRDYASQTEVVAVARARLGSSAPAGAASSIINRQIWSGPKADVYGTVSPDGRYLSFVDWDTGNLGVRDLTAGTDRYLTNKGSWEKNQDFAEESVISPDGTQAAYAWYVNALGRYQIRLLRLDQSSGASPRILVDDPNVTYIAPYSWSPDSATLGVAIMGARRTMQIGLVRVRDGAVTILKTVDRRGLNKVMLSPDGRFVAYDTTAGSASSGPHDVFVISADGAVETPTVVHRQHDVVVGWSPSGDRLLFASDRSGSMGLWAMPMKDGKPDGAAMLIKSDIAANGMGLTRNGTLFYGIQNGAIRIYTASIDFSSGKLLSSPKEAGETYLSNNTKPAWSTDGRSLAYISQGTRGRPSVLTVLSLDSGRIEETVPQMDMLDKMRWLGTNTLICNGADLSGRLGIYKLDMKTGEANLMLSGNGGFLSYASASADGKLLVFQRPSASKRGVPGVFVHDVGADTDRELVTDARVPALSPDERHVAYIALGTNDPSKATLNVIPIDGGTPRVLGSVNPLADLVEWTPDGRRIVTNKAVGDRTIPIVVSVDGGAPVELALPADWRSRMLRVHPDGRQIAFGAGATSHEVWALENFLPAKK